MTHILMEGYDIDAPWLYDELKKYIMPEHRVAVVAFSFRDEQVRGAEDWAALYGKDKGKYYHRIVDPFAAYGIPEENITFLNYFADSKESAANKVRQSDILYFLGGLPDRMLERIEEFELLPDMLRHRGVVMGYSAGAVIQLTEYHLSPDDDYPEFGYYRGIPYLNDFYLEVHYQGNEVQDDAIRRVLQERGKPVYATQAGKGALVVDNGVVYPLGAVERFVPEGNKWRNI